MDRRELEQEYSRRITRYYEEHKKYEELLSQFVSVSWVSPGEPIPRPKRVFDAAAIQEIREAKQKLDRLRREMDETEDRLYAAYH